MKTLQYLPWSLLLSFSFSLAQDDPPENVGKEMCLACHEVSAGFLSSIHSSQECEACHGPGSAHADAGGDIELIRNAQADDWVSACLGCHALGEKGLGSYLMSPHGKNRLECRDCHVVHPEKGNFGLLRAAKSVTLCVECHRSAEAAFRKPFHHPVLEGGMECVDCHNPHKDARESLRRFEVVAQYGCTSCHADKKGPFIFPHTPVEIDDCQVCHQPHGSFNARMLQRNQVHQLCLECHSLAPDVATSQPPAFHDLRSPRYRNCTICHREIHGSNVNPAFVR